MYVDVVQRQVSIRPRDEMSRCTVASLGTKSVKTDELSELWRIKQRSLNYIFLASTSILPSVVWLNYTADNIRISS